MRTMLFELRPTALEAANFETLLEQLGDALHGRTRIPVQIECDEIPDLIPSVKVGFYRIAQEAINNIIKHSKATQIQIELRKRSGEVLLRISDNGCGFDPAKTSHSGLGLEIMQERAKNIQANLEIDSQINQGTQITAQWMAPVQNENEV
jgi:signal transduction histidine kinase